MNFTDYTNTNDLGLLINYIKDDNDLKYLFALQEVRAVFDFNFDFNNKWEISNTVIKSEYYIRMDMYK